MRREWLNKEGAPTIYIGEESVLNSLIGWPTWSAPFIPWLARRSTYSLPVYDLTLKKAKFGVKGNRIRPLPDPDEDKDVGFSAWRFAHAVKKAELTKPIGKHLANATSLGFLIENGYLFDWSSNNFRLAEDAISALDDFSRTGLAGRIAQGMALLCMEKQGYSFVDRFSSFCRRHNVPTTQLNKGKRVKLSTPDFVLEKDAATRALAESKGGFVSAGNLADIKGDLAAALDQLQPWGGQFQPAITKKFAIGTFLRETDDPHEEPSLIALVDPEGVADSERQEVPPESIRRANYAAWLRGMGYIGVAQRIGTSPRGETVSAKFLTGEFLGRRYAFVPVGLFAPANMSLPDFDEGFPGLEFLPYHLLRRANFQLEVVALDLDILKKIGASSIRSNWAEITNLEPLPSRDEYYSRGDRYVVGSSFADGSFVGVVGPHIWLEQSVRTEIVEF